MKRNLQYEYTSIINNHFQVSKNYTLTNEEEDKNINFINQLLKEFKIQLDFISFETTGFSIMPLGRKICQTIIELLLKKEGYCITKYAPFQKIIQFSFDNDIIPKKHYKTLNFIRIQANGAIHGFEPKYAEYMSFFRGFSEFINWFNRQSENKQKIIEDITLKINSITESSKNIKNIKKRFTPVEYKFDKKEEVNDISQINKLLNDYAKQLNLMSSEKKFYYVFLGSTISELMLRLLLKKEKYYYPDGRHTFYHYINILSNQGIIPEACEDFLYLIRRYRNKFVYGEPPFKLVLSFLNAMNYFLQWFNRYYYQNYQNKFQIEECCELINLLTYDEINNNLIFTNTKKINYSTENELKLCETEIKEILLIKEEIKNLKKVKSLKDNNTYNSKKNTSEFFYNEKIKRLTEELKTLEKIHQKQIDELNKKNNEILKELNQSVIQLGKCMDILEKIQKQGTRVESKIDNLHSKIDNISNQINTIQSLTEKQINKAQSPEEIERIIQSYIDECIENIMNYSINFSENQNYQIEKKKLIYSIGKNSWNKLSEKSKTFLITSKVMYNHLITMEDIIDYSGICILVTKALEVEIQKRFFTNFLDYLYKKYGTDYKKYHTALLYQKRKPLLSEKFTMGNIAFVLCYIENKYDKDNEKNNNKLQLMEYCKECIFSKYNEDEIEKLLTKYASSIEEIREKYRNPSAHTNKIKRVNAEECFNLVLDIEKLLKKMLDSFDE